MTQPDQIIHGDCTQVLRTVPDASANLVVTDPPYITRYRSRDGRSVINDDNDGWLKPAFIELYRVLKPDAFCVSFYGWNRVDAFFRAWTEAGFRPVGHIVRCKNYTSRTGFLQARHEQAYLLAKGHPAQPAEPLGDVQPWEYTGNRVHPTEKAVGIPRPLVECFSQPGDTVLDPFAGSGSTLVAAALTGRRYLGIELEAKYCDLARKRLAGVSRVMRHPRAA
jgi:site-specific DNA-methyltransferase (adenine-specific)